MPFDEEAAEITINWYREMGWLGEGEGVETAVEKKMYCTGCHGDREIHWSSDCWILKCCVDERGLDHCNECPEFPCSKLVEWSEQSSKYKEALERLSSLRPEA
jgi:hypothetical protein